ncbi:MAG: IS110 family transposase [Bacteroidota bacterium]|nr:IS110 family transposase [Bacteroidota bacterium]
MRVQNNKIDFSGQNIYVGIDSHLKSYKVSLYHDDIALKTFSQDPSPDILVKHLRKNYPNANFFCAYEAGYSGFWLQRSLEKLGINCIVVNPADVPTTDKEKKLKNDKRDCKKIARSLRNQELEAIHIPSLQVQEDRQIIRHYSNTVKERTRIKVQIKAFLNYYGIVYPEEFSDPNKHWSKSFIQWLKTLELTSDSGSWAIQQMVQEYQHRVEVVKTSVRKIRDLSQQDRYKTNVRLLRSIPGIGLIFSMIILTEIGDIRRFKNNDKLAAYVGLIPNTNSSGEKEKITGITSRGNKQIKSVIVEAAWASLRYDPSLLSSFTKLKARMDGNKAIIRIAKKMLGRIRYVLINQQEYQISY